MSTRGTARRIKAKPGFVTGQLAIGQEYEDLLERDFLKLLQFDLSVREFIAQAIDIEYEFHGSIHIYTPDVLIHYHPYPDGNQRKTDLVEVKPDAFEANPGTQDAAKFDAARRVCEREGWRFLIVREDQIRIPRLGNAEFLFRYVHRAHNPALTTRLVECLTQLRGSASAEQLLSAVCCTRAERAKWFPELWTLVAQRKIGADLDQPLTMNSMLSLRSPK